MNQTEALRIRRVQANTKGRDIAVGDVHGHFTRLQSALNAIGFNPEVDRLFSVGDLVDRGPESAKCIEWLSQPWFHTIQGNHEDIAVRHVKHGKVDTGIYLANGGAWFLAMNADEQAEYATLFADQPIALEVETAGGLVGLVHADCPFESWDDLRLALEGDPRGSRQVVDYCQWSRQRHEDRDRRIVVGVKAVVVGHTPMADPLILGNVHYIDTGGWFPDNGRFTFLELNTLEVIQGAEQ
jgi:serine/threonine protein phosphatase 1